jgi:hypothetical protein
MRYEVVCIGIAQETSYAFSADRLPSKRVTFEFRRNKSIILNLLLLVLG